MARKAYVAVVLAKSRGLGTTVLSGQRRIVRAALAGVSMKFVIEWTGRPGQTIADAEKSMTVFGKWSPDPSVTFHQFVTRADGQGGFAVVETDDARTLLRDAGLFSPWMEFNAYPVVDMLDAAPIQQEVLDLLTSV